MYRTYVSHILGSDEELKDIESGNEYSTSLLLYNKDMRDILSSVVCPLDEELGERAPYIPYYCKQLYAYSKVSLL